MFSGETDYTTCQDCQNQRVRLREPRRDGTPRWCAAVLEEQKKLIGIPGLRVLKVEMDVQGRAISDFLEAT